MARFVLTNNYFEFGPKTWHQIAGTAIGTKCAPPYACIFMDQFETDFLETQVLQPFAWFRYIDDVFFIWTHGKENLKNFMCNLNEFNDSIKFTYDSHNQKINFLDVNINISNGKLNTDLYVKSTDRHQYLHYMSSHPEHTKRSIIYSQTLRVKRLCSLEKNFKTNCTNLKSWFLKRAYPEKVIDEQMSKVTFANDNKKNNNYTKGVPFVVTYHPLLNSLWKIIKDNLYLLYMSPEAKRVFTPAPMVSFRSARKLSSYLVRAKLYPIERVVGSKKCNKVGCEVCKNVSETDTFTSTVTNETFKINHKLTCDDKCLVYLLNCNVCQKQYTGQTTNAFRYRWNNYKSNDKKFQRGEQCMQDHLFRHFYSEGHDGFIGNVSISFIDKTDGFDPTKRENFWMRTLKTLAPHGLNIEQSI